MSWTISLLIGVPSHLIKGVGAASERPVCQVYIDRCRVQRPVSEKIFDRDQVCTILVEVGGIGMTESMRSDPVFPAKLFLMLLDQHTELSGTDWYHRAVLSRLYRKKPVHRSAAGSPVFVEDLQGSL